MELLFRSGGELIKLGIDREKKKLIVMAEKYNYKEVKMPYSELFGVKGNPETERMEKEMETKTDSEFKEYLEDEFQKKGFTMIN